MLSRSHGRVCQAVASCLILVILILRFRHSYVLHNAFPFSKQYSSPSKTARKGIANSTLGFEKIFIINAPWRTDRKDSISLAASYSGISVDWIDGIQAEDIREKAYPPGDHRQISDGNKGSWRAHMNAIRAIVEQNLTTSLISEDDADWDFRIRNQLLQFSHGAKRIPKLVKQAELHATKHMTPGDEELSQLELAKRSSIAIHPLTASNIPHEDPYGRDWDVIWLGHCGAQLPPPSPHSPNRLMMLGDETVPEPQYLKPMSHAPLDTLASLYAPHTRLIHRANSTLCTIAYAVTQSGARKLLYEFGIREFSKGFDFALSDWCNGLTRDATKEKMPMCVVVQPPIFGHNFGERGGSDIMGVGVGGRPVRETRYVKWSVRMNLERLVRGEEGIEEQWTDAKDRLKT